MTNLAGRREVRLGGVGGQGLQLSARILATALIAEGHHIAQSQSYEPTSRGGLSRADVVIDRVPIDYPLVTALDALVVLDQMAVAPSQLLLKPSAIVVADTLRVPKPPNGAARVHRFNLAGAAHDLGNSRVANLVALGALAALTPLCPRQAIEQAIRQEVPARLRDINLKALSDGYALFAAAPAG